MHSSLKVNKWLVERHPTLVLIPLFLCVFQHGERVFAYLMLVLCFPNFYLASFVRCAIHNIGGRRGVGVLQVGVLQLVCSVPRVKVLEHLVFVYFCWFEGDRHGTWLHLYYYHAIDQTLLPRAMTAGL